MAEVEAEVYLVEAEVDAIRVLVKKVDREEAAVEVGAEGEADNRLLRLTRH